MPKVSALVSAYYAEDFLIKRLENLKDDTGFVEVIVVCQKASIEERIASFFDVKVVTTPDIPLVGEAWNLAIKHATGDYLTTANTDDAFLPGGLQAMAEALDTHAEIGLVFAQVIIDNGKSARRWRRIKHTTGEVEDIKDILYRRSIIGPMPLWRRSIHSQVGYFDETYVVVSDTDMWLGMVNAGVRFWYIDQPTGIYQQRRDGLEWRNKSLGLREAREMRQDLCVTE
jgi:O-antigen biosynthesis protein